MKVISIQKRRNKIEIIKPTANFQENVDFLPIGTIVALIGKCGGKKRKSSFYFPCCDHVISHASFWFGFYVLRTFKVIYEWILN